MQGRFRIQSFSSQNDSFPIGNLLAKHSPWQSQRFCDYPQEITISFYQPVRLHTIKIAAHSTKIPSRINILYHLPQQQDRGFVKYGFITFSEGNQSGVNPIQVKELANVGIDVLEMRFLVLRNHPNKNNFFNQVALSLLAFTASPIDHLIPAPPPLPNRSLIFNFDPQINIFQQLKANFIRREQFEQAKQVKQVLGIIDRATNKLDELQADKQKMIKTEDFLGAKRVKESMLQYRQEVNQLIANFYDPEKKVLRTVKSDERLRKKVEQLNLLKNSSVFSESSSEPHTPRRSRVKQQPSVLKEQMQIVSQGEAEDEEGEGVERNESMVSHEDRILPAVMSRIKGMGQTQPIPQSSQVGDNQFFENGERQPLPAQPEAMSPSDEANSSILNQFYDVTFIRKLHSKHWQFRLQAIQKALEELKQNNNPSSAPLEKNRLRAHLFIYSQSLKSHNFQIATASLQFMNNIAPLKLQSESIRGELHNELQHAIRGTIKKLSDSNQKVRGMGEKTLLRIIQSPLFGVQLCYSALIKSYPEKVSARIRRTKIEQIQYMVDHYGVGEGAVPPSVADFALRAAGDQDAEVRKSAISLGRVVKQRGGKQRLDSLLMESSGVKASIAKQLSH